MNEMLLAVWRYRYFIFSSIKNDRTLEQLRNDELFAAEALAVELRRSIDVEHAKGLRLGAETLAQQARFEATLDAERCRRETLVAQQAGYEARIETLDDLSRQHAFGEGELTAQLRLRDETVAALSSQARLAQTQLAALRDAHAAEIERFQAHVSWIEGERQAASAHADQARREAHRWWVEAEELRTGLACIENSLSWRITAPLRAARRVAAVAVHFPVRTAKAMARPIALWSMRRSLSVPFLRERLPGMLDAQPALKSRFRNLALGAGLIHDEVPAVPATLPSRRAAAHRQASQPPLSPRATRVLADLRRAIQERHG